MLNSVNAELLYLVHAGQSAHELAILLNSAYATLSNTRGRQAYDDNLKHIRRERGHFDGRPVSAWHGDSGEQL